MGKLTGYLRRIRGDAADNWAAAVRNRQRDLREMEVLDGCDSRYMPSFTQAERSLVADVTACVALSLLAFVGLSKAMAR